MTGFRSGKENPYNKLKVKYEQALQDLEYERSTKPILQKFAEELGKAMLVQLAHQPYEKWPQFAKNTFAYVATLAPAAAYAYKDALPKE